MITVVTPFKRKENLPFLTKVLNNRCHWIVLQADDEEAIDFPEWVTVKRYRVTNKTNISNRLFNEFISEGLEADTQYMLLNDDDSVEEGFFGKIPDAPVVCVSMRRNDYETMHHVWDDWAAKKSHLEFGQDILMAKPENMKVACVAGEQLIVKGSILKNFRYGLEDSTADMPGDARFVLQVVAEHEPVYVPDAYVLFNYFEDSRFKSFRRKPIVLFVGDYYCAGVKSMGISEWETNLWKSLESTDMANVGRFHLDRYFYETGQRGDDELIKRVQEIKPDYVVLVMYKQFGSDPTAINHKTIYEISQLSKIISIWGDLEAEEQQVLAAQVAPYAYLMVGTASKEIVEGLGFTYMHVPKDPRVFNNPGKERDIDVLFNGSFGRGREERSYVLDYINKNLPIGTNVVFGGSEGGDHFTTEEYADRYKRAKIAISFSRARGKDVVNARPFEAMLCGALVLNQESAEMEKLYTSGEDFIEWNNKEQLLLGISICLKNWEVSAAMAMNGQKKTEQLYSAKTFWEKVLA